MTESHVETIESKYGALTESSIFQILYGTFYAHLFDEQIKKINALDPDSMLRIMESAAYLADEAIKVAETAAGKQLWERY